MPFNLEYKGSDDALKQLTFNSNKSTTSKKKTTKPKSTKRSIKGLLNKGKLLDATKQYKVVDDVLSPVATYVNNNLVRVRSNDGDKITIDVSRPYRNKRVRENTSPTAKGDLFDSPIYKNSTNFENAMDWLIYHPRLEKGSPNEAYTIPFIEDKAVKVLGNYTSENALDSLAKYAGQARISLEEGLGLGHESMLGSVPKSNVGSALKNTAGGNPYTKEENKIRDRIISNANYFRNMGSIPAESFVRDFEYNTGGYNGGKPYDRNLPPLLHAFDFYDRGLYNPGDENHSRNTLNYGVKMLEEPAVKRWYEKQGKRIYEENKNNESSKAQLRKLDKVYKVKRKHSVE